MSSETICINNVHYEVFNFKYVFGKFNGSEEFILLEDIEYEIDEKKVSNGKIYIIIPSWVEMQDLYQCNSEKNPMTQKYEVNVDKMNMKKTYKICTKIIGEDNDVLIMSRFAVENMCIDLVYFINEKIEEVIYKYYIGTGLSEEEQKDLEYDCFKYYTACQKRARGEHNVSMPFAPGAVSLLNICDMFGCTPDVARKISKRDIDMIAIARNQKDFTSNPVTTGFNPKKFNNQMIKKRR